MIIFKIYKRLSEYINEMKNAPTKKRTRIHQYFWLSILIVPKLFVFHSGTSECGWFSTGREHVFAGTWRWCWLQAGRGSSARGPHEEELQDGSRVWTHSSHRSRWEQAGKVSMSTDMFACAYMSVHTCLYIHVCTYMYVHTCLCIHVCTYMSVHTCLCIHVCAYMSVHTCLCIHVYAYMSVCMSVCAYMSMHTCLYVCLCIRVWWVHVRIWYHWDEVVSDIDFQAKLFCQLKLPGTGLTRSQAWHIRQNGVSLIEVCIVFVRLVQNQMANL